MSLVTTNPRRFSEGKEDKDLTADTIFSNFKRLQEQVFDTTRADDEDTEGKIYFRTDLTPPEARVRLNGVVYKLTLTPV